MSTYEPIASQTLGSTAASVIFSSIPQGYTDIVLVAQATSSGEIFMRFDGDTGANYSGTEIWTGGSGVNSQRASNENYITLRDFSTTLGNNMSVVNIMNYSNSTTNKTVLIRTNDNRYSRVYARVALWRNTSAINEITLFNSSGTFASGSTFSLYGIQVGDKAQKAQGGNIVTSDGTYVYHTFTSSGAFIPSQALTVDYLVVAGGGGAGGRIGGGGGAGGYKTSIGGSTLSVTAKSYPVIIGAGGTGGTGDTGDGTNGNDSIFSTITSTGGGGGGAANLNNAVGKNGGSGGGGAGNNFIAGTHAGGTASPSGQGNNGGSGSGTLTGLPAGGGGGSNAVGANATTSQGGNGGAGTSNSISGSAITYAAGGGGGTNSGTAGTGGSSIGGNGAVSGNGTAATINTGSGGGGGSGTGGSSGGAGSSGIVIIRYAV